MAETVCEVSTQEENDHSIAQEKAAKFNATIEQHVFGGVISLGLALGSQLEVFDKMIELNKPATARTIAASVDCKERYIEELLRMLVSGDVVDFNERGQETFYFIPLWKQSALRGAINGCCFIPLLAAPYSKLVSCFLTNGPLGLDEEDVLPVFSMWQKSRDMFFRTFVESIPACYPKTAKKIDSNCYSLDIGCGDGIFFNQLATVYPDSAFLGIDISDSLIKQANEANKSLSNVHFQVHEATKLPDEWTEKFDYVFLVETLHDLPFARETLQECRRVLARGGILSVVDINISSSLAEQKKLGFGAVITYAFSLYHCLSRALASPKAEGLGPCYGYENLQKLIESVGFTDVVVKDIPGLASCVHFYTQKPL